MRSGKRMAKAKEERIKQTEIENFSMAYPSISNESRILTMGKENIEVVQRLTNYAKKCDAKRLERAKEVWQENNCTFKPQIDHNRIQKILTHRVDSKGETIKNVEIKENKPKKFSDEEKCTFHPKISTKSAKIAEKLVFFTFLPKRENLKNVY